MIRPFFLPTHLPVLQVLRLALGCALLCAVTAVRASAQSSDAAFPTPVLTSEITGQIAPRDLGDARLTRHFYTFNGTEGDLSLTVESTGLDGDVDLYTATGLRPLTKITLYGGLSPTHVTKSVYLRTGEALVLRVEGRSIAEGDATYRIRFEGAFLPASGALASAPAPVVPTLPETRSANARRVTSAGARIPEPPRPAPTPDETTNAETAATTPAPATSTRRPARNTPAPARTARGSTSRPARNTRARTPRAASTTAPANDTARTSTNDAATTGAPSTNADTSPATSASTTRPAARSTPARAPRRSSGAGRRGRAPAETETSTNNPASAPGASAAPNAAARTVTATRLVIETKDGERIERDMSAVRRVTVENNQLVIVGRDGRIERQPMANILKMSIEP